MVQNLGQTDNSYVSLGRPPIRRCRRVSRPVPTRSGTGCRASASTSKGQTTRTATPKCPLDRRRCRWPCTPIRAGSGARSCSTSSVPPNSRPATASSRHRRERCWHRTPPTCWSGDTTGAPGTGLQKTSSNSEDSGAQSGSSIANAFYRGADLGSLSEDSGGNALELAVYTVVNDKAPFVEGGIPVPLSWLHIPDGAYAGYQFRLLYVTHRGRLPTSGGIEEYNTWVRWEAEQAYSDPIIRGVSKDIKAVVCTADVDARTNTGMAGTGVPIHWLDGGWEDRPTLIADSYADFYSDEWENTEYGTYVTGNSAYFHPAAKVWTGCDASGDAHPGLPHGRHLSHGHGRRGHTERFGGQ